MAAGSSTAASASSSSPVLSGPHRRRPNDIEPAVPDSGLFEDDHDDDGHRGDDSSALAIKALFFLRRKSLSAVDLAWMRNAVACLLGLVVVVGLLSSHQGGGGNSVRLVRRVEVADDHMLGWTEENLTAIARLPADPTVRRSRR